MNSVLVCDPFLGVERAIGGRVDACKGRDTVALVPLQTLSLGLSSHSASPLC